jgi:protein phosphatase
MNLSHAGHTDVGMKRKQNQDNFLMLPEEGLFVVADGMGGHQGGETASLLAVNTIAEFFRSHKNEKDPRKRLQNAIVEANQAIQTRGLQDANLQGMGTTTTALHFTADKLYIGHVGDSRSYLVQDKSIWQLTRDHSLVQEKLRAGLNTRDQLKTDRMKNVITRSVGFESVVDIDLYEVEPSPGDVYIVCSDGLSGMIEDKDILAVITDCVYKRKDLDAAAKQLIEAANRNGGDDNVTALIVKVDA